MKRYFTNLSILVALLTCLATFGATTINAAEPVCLSITNTTAFTENFNNLAATGTAATVVPPGFGFLEVGTGANTTYAADAGATASGNTYSYGTGTTTERAFGGLQSGTVTPTIGGCFINNTGNTISAFAISYTGEQWRLGATGRVDRLDFQYSTTATSIAGTTGYIDVDALDFTAPVTTGTANGRDGDAAANRTALTSSIGGLSISNGGTFYIRWNDLNAAGADDGLAVDDFSITATTGAAAVAGVTVTQSGGTTDVAEGGATDSYTVVLNSAPTADVTINIAPGTQVTTAPTALTFTSANFATPQTVTVTAVDDAAVEGAHTGLITQTAASTDAAYNNIAVAGVTANITDNDAAQTAPAFTSANNTTFTVGTAASFPVTTSGSPAVTSITSMGALPSGVTFVYNNNGTATLSGTPAAGTAGSYPLTFTATNGVNPDATQSFTLTVVDASAPAQVVISQIYGGGGNASATYTNDYVELHNNGTTTATLNNYSIQYAAAGNTTNFGNITALPATITIPAGGYYLIQLASSGAVGAALPTADFVAMGTGNTNASATAGKFALVSSTTAVSSTATTGATVVDFVGFGTTANASEGGAPAPAGSNANGIFRLAGGCTDTNNNMADFVAMVALARNSTSPVNVCGGAVNPTVSLTVTSNTAAEATPAATITVTATASSAVTADTIVTLTPSGTATSGSDYTLGSTTITILSGATTGTTTFNTIDDAVVDADETAIFTISAVTGSTATVGTPNSQTITITDNDAAPVVTCGTTTVTAPASDSVPTALTGTNAGNISIYNTTEQQGDTATTRTAVDAQDDAWRSNAVTRVGASNISNAWSAPANAMGNVAVGNPYALFTYKGVSVTVSLRNMGTDINTSPCTGTAVAATATQPEISSSSNLQANSPRPATLFNATGAMNSTQPKFYNENIGLDSTRNALLFTFSTPVDAFGAWFGDVETAAAGQLAVVRLFDVNGDRIGDDVLIQPGAGFDGDAETRWIGFVDNVGSASIAPGDPRVKSMLVIVGDNTAGSAGLTEHLSFIGATIGTNNVSTAAGVSTSGKVLNAKNRGISRARVSITDTTTGDVRTTFTGVDGAFGFDELAAGRFYIVSVSSKRHTFDDNQQGFQLFEDNDGLVFRANR